MVPDIALIGVAKGGTTALASWFDRHPDVAVSRVKEPNFFSQDVDPSQFSKAYRNMSPALPESYWSEVKLRPAHQDFVRDSARYARLFEHAQPGQKTLDASTSYFFSKTAPQALWEANSNAHIVLLLRNPVDRAFSHFRMARKYGMVKGDFLSVLKEDAALPGIWGQNENFVHLSLYAEALGRWQAIWPAEQLHIHVYEAFFQDATSSFAALCQSLGLAEMATESLQRVFEGQDPAFPALQRFFMQHPLGRTLKSLLPPALLGNVKQWLNSHQPLTLTGSERDQAWAFFREDVNQCQALLNRPLSLWS